MTSRRSKALALVVTSLAAATAVACSSSNSHPTGAAECTPGVNCVGVGSPGGPILGSDATTDGDAAETSSDAGVDAADAPDTGPTITVTAGTVNLASSPTVDPSSDPIDTTDGNLAIIAAVGGVATQTLVTAGHFATGPVDVDASGFARLNLVDISTKAPINRTYYELFFDGTKTRTTPLPVPLFDKNASATWVGDLGLSIATAGTATLVYQLVDATGAGVPGINVTLGTGPTSPCTAATTDGPCGPYYDNGDKIAPGAATGPRGTAVFLGVAGGGASDLFVDVDLGGAVTKSVKSISIHNDTITFVRVPVK